MTDKSEISNILSILQEREYTGNTHREIIRHIANSKKNGKNIMPQAIKILNKTTDEQEATKQILEL